MRWRKLRYYRMQSLFLRVLTCCSLSTGAVWSQPIVTIDPSVRYQTIRGFGGSMTFSEQFLNTMPQGAFDHLVWRLFDDLRLNIVRVRMRNEIEPVNDNGDPDSINWSNVHALPDTAVIRLLRAGRAGGRNVNILATPWSPPSWMKTNDTTINGGHLKPAMEAELAEWIRIFLLIWRDQYGLPIQLLSIQNEPSYVATYESCIYTPAEMNRALRLVVPRLRNWGFSSLEIIAPDDASAEASLSFADSLLLPADIRVMLAGFAVHNYSTAYTSPTQKVAQLQTIKQRCASASVPVWHTEYGNLNNTAAGSLGEAILEGWHWIVALNDLGSSTYLHWQLAASKRSNGTPLGVALVQFNIDNSTFYIPKKYYFIKHFSKFIQPNSLRINLTGLSSSIVGTAFIDSAQTKGCTILENLNATAQSLRISWPGADTFAVWRSSRTDTCIQLTPLVRSGSFFDVTMPDSSIVTLVGNLQGSNSVNLEGQPAGFQLSQNYPNPFSAGGGSAFGGNPTTTITFTLPSFNTDIAEGSQFASVKAPRLAGESDRSRVSLKVYDLLGREVATVVNDVLPVGAYNVQFDARDLASGVYVYRLVSGFHSESRRMILIR
jgi:O-glycosyl hydrolase